MCSWCWTKNCERQPAAALTKTAWLDGGGGGGGHGRGGAAKRICQTLQMEKRGHPSRSPFVDRWFLFTFLLLPICITTLCITVLAAPDETVRNPGFEGIRQKANINKAFSGNLKSR